MAQEILRWLAIAEGQRAVFGTEESGVFRTKATAAGFDPHIGRQAAGSWPQQLGHTRAEMRVRHATVLGIAALDAIHARGVGIVLGTHAAHHAELVHLFGKLWHQLAKLHARHGGLDAAEGTAKLGVRFWVPRLKLGEAAIQPHKQHLLVLLPHGLGQHGGGEQAQTSAKEGAAGEAVVAGSAERIHGK